MPETRNDHTITMPAIKDVAEGTSLVEDLLLRCQRLLSELEAFRLYLDEARHGQNAEHAVDIKQFCGPVATEFKSLQKV